MASLALAMTTAVRSHCNWLSRGVRAAVDRQARAFDVGGFRTSDKRRQARDVVHAAVTVDTNYPQPLLGQADIAAATTPLSSAAPAPSRAWTAIP